MPQLCRRGRRQVDAVRDRLKEVFRANAEDLAGVIEGGLKSDQRHVTRRDMAVNRPIADLVAEEQRLISSAGINGEISGQIALKLNETASISRQAIARIVLTLYPRNNGCLIHKPVERGDSARATNRCNHV